MKKQVTTYIGIGLLLIGLTAGGFYIYQSNNQKNEPTLNTAQTTTPDSTWENNILTYSGKDGITAEDLIKQVAKVTKDQYGMIASINDVAPNNTQYWQFNVNGASSNEGAGTYVTKDTDTITWKLSSF